MSLEKTLFLVTGATSACNHVGARILVNMGCYGSWKGNPREEQAELDETAVHGSPIKCKGPAVLWRSVGYKATLPDLLEVKENFQRQGWEVKTIYLVRNWSPMIESAQLRHRERNFEDAFNLAHEENEHILKAISYLQPFHILNISLFFKYPKLVIERLEDFTNLKFSEEAYKDFFDADVKWEFDAGKWVIEFDALKTWNLPKAYSNIPWTGSCASKTVGAILPGLMCAYRIDTAVEIGIANGFTTHALLRGLAAANNGKGFLISCDLNELSCQIAKSADLNTPDVNHLILCEDSTKTDWGKHLGDRQIGIAYIDGDHSHEVAKQDIEKLAPFVKLGGFLFCHDYASGQPGVVHAVNEFLDDSPEWQMFVLPQRPVYGDYAAAILQRVGSRKSIWWDK